jgi:O-antigen ligase
VLFVLLNAVLFVRPAEVVPGLGNVPIYEVLILACVLVSLKPFLAQLRGPALAAAPLTVCVLGLLASVLMSHLAHFSFGEAVQSGAAFAKVVVYYLLFVAVVNSTARLQQFLGWLVVFIVVLTGLALLQYHGAIDVPSLASYAERQDELDEATGEQMVLVRLCSTGIYNNPNDLSRILVVGITICVYALAAGTLRVRLLSLPPLGLFGYALALTQSRGGFLAMLASVAAVAAVRFGKWRALAAALVVLPVLFAVFGGRQTHITTAEGTGRQRLEIWSAGFDAFRETPVFGIGMDQYQDVAGGYVAHNSFVQCYTEVGFVGGTCFTGAFGLGLWLPYRLGPRRLPRLEPALRRLRPCLVALVAGSIVGMLSSTRSYGVPTYMLLGVCAVYVRLATRESPGLALRWNPRLVGRLAALSAAVLLLLYVYVRVSLY